MVEGEEIIAVGPVGEVAVSVGAGIVDGSGGYLAPGLADVHAHLYFDPSPDFITTTGLRQESVGLGIPSDAAASITLAS